ncbi:MAG: hypothetical protein AAF467_04730 [Actinomycetota bacterium]
MLRPVANVSAWTGLPRSRSRPAPPEADAPAEPTEAAEAPAPSQPSPPAAELPEAPCMFTALMHGGLYHGGAGSTSAPGGTPALTTGTRAVPALPAASPPPFIDA